MTSTPAPTPPQATSFYRSPLAAGLVILLLTFLAHGNSLFNSFIWDDDQYIFENPTLTSPTGLHDIWFVSSATPQYYPLVHTSFWIEHAMWGFWPMGFHFDNILLHALSSVLLWLLLKRLKVPGAWIAAAIFAVHPVHVETVAWVTERKNTLSALFYLGAFHAFLSFSPADEDKPLAKRDWRFFALSFLFLVAALLSKTVTCSLPAAILLIYWWKRPRANESWFYIPWRDVLLLVPFFAIGLGLGLHTAYLEKTQVGANGVEWSHIFFLERCLIAGNALAFYAWKLIWPVELTFIYPYPLSMISRAKPELYIAPALVILTFLSAFLLQKKISRGPFTALMFFAITLFPALGFLNVFPFRYSIVADHFQYLASIGFITLMAATVTIILTRLITKLGENLAESKELFMGVTAAFLLASLSLNTVLQAFVYRSLEVLWLDTLQKNPDCWLAQNNLGILYQNAGRDDLAKEHFAEAVRVSPNSFESLSNYGHILASFGENEFAMQQFQRSVIVDPYRPDAYLNVGEMMILMGRQDEGRAMVEKAILINKQVKQHRMSLAMAMYLEGRAYMVLHRYDEAIATFEKMQTIERDNTELYQMLGISNLKAGRVSVAAALLSQAVRSAHENPMLRTIRTESMNLLSRIYASSQDAVEGRPEFQKVIDDEMKLRSSEIKDPTKFRMTLATDLATDSCELATKDSPHYPAYLDTLAMAHAAAGRYSQAVDVATAAAAFARELHMEKLAVRIDARRKLYENKKAYVAPGADLMEE